MRSTKLLAALAVVSVSSISAFAAGNLPVTGGFPQYKDTLRVDVQGNLLSVTSQIPGATTVDKNSPPALGFQMDVYDNTGGAVLTGFGQPTASTPIYGDTLTLADTGRLDEIAVTLWNSGSTGIIKDGVMQINLYDNTTPYAGGAITNPLLGTLNINVNRVTALNPGFYSYVYVTGLAGLGIDFTSTNLLLTQQWTNGANSTSTANGVVILDPPSVGSSPNTLVFGNTANPLGLYTLGSPAINSNPGIYIYVPEPASLSVLAFAAPMFLRRRKA